MEKNMEIIKVEKVTKSYVIYEKKPGLLGIIKSFFKTKKIIKNAVDDISFSVNEGEIIGYIGLDGQKYYHQDVDGNLNTYGRRNLVDGIVLYKTAVSMRTGVVRTYAVMVGFTAKWSFTVLKEIYRSDKEYLERMEYLTDLWVKRIYETTVHNCLRSKNESRARRASP